MLCLRLVKFNVTGSPYESELTCSYIISMLGMCIRALKYFGMYTFV